MSQVVIAQQVTLVCVYCICHSPAIVRFMINIYLKDHFSLCLEVIHIIITVPVARADSVLHATVGKLIQLWYGIVISLITEIVRNECRQSSSEKMVEFVVKG